MRKVLFFPMGMVLLCLNATTLPQRAMAQQTVPAGKQRQEKMTVDAALKKLEKKYGVTFVYDKTLANEKYTSFNPDLAGSQSVEDQLKAILYPNGLLFLYIKKDYYAITVNKDKSNHVLTADNETKKDESSSLPAATLSAARGRVTDDKGAPLERISVQVAGTTTGAYTDADGVFKIPNAANKKLMISGVGYTPQEVTASGVAPVNVKLIASSKELTEVVVVGYGEQKRAKIVGAVATVNSKEITEAPVARVTDALSGRVPGLFVSKANGAPGKGSTFYVRGISTTNNSEPLVVIDGIPNRSLDDLAPTDVETISVLKDASAIAVYGARAANGVILVTTKAGQSGKPSISFSGNLTVQQQTRALKPLGSYEYAGMYNVALKNENSFNPAVGKGYTDEVLEKFRTGSDPDRHPNTDWYNDILAPTSVQQRYDLSVSGGNEKTRYFVSAGYNNEGGFYPMVTYKRYNVRSSLQSEIAKGLLFDVKMAGIMSDSRDARATSGTIMKIAISSPPYYTNKYSNGLYGFVPAARGNIYQQSRGEDGYRQNSGNTFNGTMSLQYKLPFAEGLSVKGTFAYDRNIINFRSFAKPYALYTMDNAGNMKKANNAPTAPELTENNRQNYYATSEFSVNYDRSFKDHHVGGMVLYTQTIFNERYFGATGRNFVSSALEILNAADPTNTAVEGTASRQYRQGVVGRFTYDYQQKYLLEMNFRYDGSDIFPRDGRFGFFPSIGAGWVISKENFFPQRGLVDYLKLRGSWGQLGNDRVDPYQFLASYSLVGTDIYGVSHGYSFGGINPVYYQGLRLNVLPNPNFTWEKAVMSNIGFDMQLWDNRISITADYFYKRTKDILAPRAQAVPDVIGITLPVENAGIVDNRGFEISAGYNGNAGKFTYYVKPNITFARNKMVYYPEASSIPEWQRLTGKPVAIKLNGISPKPKFVSDGLYQSQDEVEKGPKPLYPTVSAGDIRYVDIDGDGKITNNDKIITDNGGYPEIQYGIAMGGRYKGFELNLLWQGNGNVMAYVYGTYSFPFYADGHAQEIHKDYWTPDNPNAAFPRLSVAYVNNTQESDFWLRNAAFIRLKNAELAYNVPAQWLRLAGIKGVRVYLNGNNLLTFSRLKQIDPEAAANGTVAYPIIRSYNAGINIQL
ncbi:TonB-linked outer membrane protein, SusC/RagA family [Chitinophaga eiseniae]|uniref:TonB-linked outer membrane protein, SusC/RagA family n=1 Tax=Chitinophaga eiseniae TaxID=634771 RepID=A0A1T4TU20_9BACT|nr:SusC/RagA family TonB-linked outer membrane protein [Chitinophaga eiseniae]SKA43963.1 TonB-linked outer membrane protein, SusC/RagA family [Chitinophaga eiseniae]